VHGRFNFLHRNRILRIGRNRYTFLIERQQFRVVLVGRVQKEAIFLAAIPRIPGSPIAAIP
jgi:hypothetical protein